MNVRKIILASSNAGKLKEIRAILSARGVQVVPQAEYQVDDIDEIGWTFVENAILKARHASEATGLPAIADDSGLEIDALNGRPGIYSARYSGEGPAANIQKVLMELKNIQDEARSARFRSVIVFMRDALDPAPIICQGTWEGRILRAPQGEQGFGYDPIFYIPECGRSAAELTATEKNERSHRAKALAQLLTFF